VLQGANPRAPLYMITLTKNNSIVGLDLEAGSLAATEVRVNGAPEVTGAGVLPLPSGIVGEGEVHDPEGLASALKQLFSEHKLSKSVRLGVANQRVVVRMLRFPAIEKPEELDAAIRFQAQEHIPMPLDQAVVEHRVVGQFATEAGEPVVDVLVVAARRDMVTPFVTAMRKAGLKPVGIDLSAFAMIRALGGEQAAEAAAAGEQSPEETPVVPYEDRIPETAEPEDSRPGTLFCNLGDVTNLAVARGDVCLFTRVSQFGIEGIAQRLAERRGLALDHARQWLVHAGLRDPVETIEGDPETVTAARIALTEGASKLVDELRLSLEYYGAQEGNLAVHEVIACGTGTTIPGLVETIEAELGWRVKAPRPAALGALDGTAAARLTLPYGLALES
jgi:type IV pilus assembly protein PilM